MNIKELIQLLSPTEKRAFIDFLELRNKRRDAKNIELFQLLEKDAEARMKKQIGANAYGALKSRLKESLLKYLSLGPIRKQHSEELSLFQTISVAKLLLEKGNMAAGLDYLLKAEKEAHLREHFLYLNEIYHLIIEYSDFFPDLDLGSMIEKHQYNQKRLFQQENMNLVYALIRKKFRQAEFEGVTVDMGQLIQTSYQDFQISEDVGFSLKSLHQLCQLADIYGASTLNYYHADQFFAQYIPEDLLLYRKKNTSHHKYLVEMLVSLANIYFRKRDFLKAQSYLNEIEKLELQPVLAKHDMAFNRFWLIQSLLHNFQGFPELAIKDLAQRKVQDLYSLLTLSMIHFQQGEYALVRSTLAQLHHSDRFYMKHFGIEQVLRRNLLEILVHIELGDLDFAESRLDSFERRFKKELQTKKYQNALSFIELVKYLNDHPETVRSDSFKKLVDEKFIWKPDVQEDIFFISFYAWLKAKMIGGDLYQVTLELM